MKEWLEPIQRILESKNISGMLVIVGLLVMLSSMVSYAGTPPSIALVSEPFYWRLGIGAFLLASGLVIYAWEDMSGAWVSRRKVESISAGFAVKVAADRQIEVVFGKIEDQAAIPEMQDVDAAIALPVNEFFDKRCFSDSKTATGTYVLKHFPPPKAEPFMDAVKAALSKAVPNPVPVETQPGLRELAFGVATCIEVKPPHYDSPRIVIVAVSTKELNVGIRSEVGFLFAAIAKLRAFMSNNHVRTIVLPLFGTGEGGLRREVALFELVIAFADAMLRPSGQHIRVVRIVIYDPDGRSPQISKRTARRILGVGTGMFPREQIQ